MTRDRDLDYISQSRQSDVRTGDQFLCSNQNINRFAHILDLGTGKS